MALDKKFKNNKLNKELKKILSGMDATDEILILENGWSLDSAIENFRGWLIENKIRHTVLCKISKLPMEYLTERLDNASHIAFQTIGGTAMFDKMYDYFCDKKNWKRTLIECYISSPSIQFIPEQAPDHTAYALKCRQQDMKLWELFKVTKDKDYNETPIVTI